MSKVTIVVPVYNAEQYLSKCINSLTNQTYSDIEIILINDGSNDSSGEICDNAAFTDKRIRVIHKNNQGVSSARNIGIDMALGKFICFVDSDDYIDKNMIEDLYNKIADESSDFVLCGHRSLYSQTGSIIEHSPLSFSGSAKEFFSNIESFIDSESIQGPCGKLFRLSIVNENCINFPAEMSFGEDTMFVYKYLSKCINISTIPKCYYNYVKINQNSLSTVIRSDKIDVFLKLYDELDILLVGFGINNKAMIHRKICTSAMYCLGEVYGTEEKIDKKIRIKHIEKILTNKTVYDCFFNRRKDNMRFAVIFFLMKTRQFKTIDTMFCIKRLM